MVGHNRRDSGSSRRSSFEIDKVYAQLEQLSNAKPRYKQIVEQCPVVDDIRKNYRRSVAKRAFKSKPVCSTPFHKKLHDSTSSCRISDITPITENQSAKTPPIRVPASPRPQSKSKSRASGQNEDVQLIQEPKEKTLREEILEVQKQVDKTKSGMLQYFLDRLEEGNRSGDVLEKPDNRSKHSDRNLSKNTLKSNKGVQVADFSDDEVQTPLKRKPHRATSTDKYIVTRRDTSSSDFSSYQKERRKWRKKKRRYRAKSDSSDEEATDHDKRRHSRKDKFIKQQDLLEVISQMIRKEIVSTHKKREPSRMQTTEKFDWSSEPEPNNSRFRSLLNVDAFPYHRTIHDENEEERVSLKEKESKELHRKLARNPFKREDSFSFDFLLSSFTESFDGFGFKRPKKSNNNKTRVERQNGKKHDVFSRLWKMKSLNNKKKNLKEILGLNSSPNSRKLANSAQTSPHFNNISESLKKKSQLKLQELENKKNKLDEILNLNPNKDFKFKMPQLSNNSSKREPRIKLIFEDSPTGNNTEFADVQPETQENFSPIKTPVVKLPNVCLLQNITVRKKTRQSAKKDDTDLFHLNDISVPLPTTSYTKNQTNADEVDTACNKISPVLSKTRSSNRKEKQQTCEKNSEKPTTSSRLQRSSRRDAIKNAKQNENEFPESENNVAVEENFANLSDGKTVLSTTRSSNRKEKQQTCEKISEKPTTSSRLQRSSRRDAIKSAKPNEIEFPESENNVAVEENFANLSNEKTKKHTLTKRATKESDSACGESEEFSDDVEMNTNYVEDVIRKLRNDELMTIEQDDSAGASEIASHTPTAGKRSPTASTSTQELVVAQIHGPPVKISRKEDGPMPTSPQTHSNSVHLPESKRLTRSALPAIDEDRIEIAESPKKVTKKQGKKNNNKETKTKKKTSKKAKNILDISEDGLTCINETDYGGLRRSKRQTRPPRFLSWKTQITEKDMEIYGSYAYDPYSSFCEPPVKTKATSKPKTKKSKKTKAAKQPVAEIPPSPPRQENILETVGEISEMKIDDNSNSFKNIRSKPDDTGYYSKQMIPLNPDSTLTETELISARIAKSEADVEKTKSKNYLNFENMLKKSVKTFGVFIFAGGEKSRVVNNKYATILNTLKGEVSLRMGHRYYEKIDDYFFIPRNTPYEVENKTSNIAHVQCWSF